MKKYIFTLFNLGIYSLVLSQTIMSDISVDIRKKTNMDSIPGLYTTRIEQTIAFTNYNINSIILYLENVSDFAATISQYSFPNNITIDVKQQNKIDYCPLPNFSFNGKKLSFTLPDSNCLVKITYDYNTLFNITYMETAIYLQAYMYSEHAWFFSHSDMTIEKITLSIPENGYFFASVPYLYDGSYYLLNTLQLIDFDISFYILQKEYYDYRSFSDTLNTVQFYFSKGLAVDSTHFFPAKKDTVLFTERSSLIHDRIQKINRFFLPRKHKKIYMADANLINGKIVWARTHAITDEEFFILLDTTMWNNNTSCHEIIHAYIPTRYNPPKNDSTHYFFSEAIVEYLSLYFSYNSQALDSICEENRRRYYEKNNSVTSIFRVSDNRLNASSVEGTSLIIYVKSPYIIHEFAEMIGGDDYFVSLLALFYQQAQAKEQISFYDMERFFKSKLVTDEQWCWLVDNL
jgi:hypothetical protein